MVGRDLSLSGGTYAYQSLLGGNDDTFLTAATSGLSYSGSVSFSGSASRVVLIGGDAVSASAGSRLDSAWPISWLPRVRTGVLPTLPSPPAFHSYEELPVIK